MDGCAGRRRRHRGHHEGRRGHHLGLHADGPDAHDRHSCPRSHSTFAVAIALSSQKPAPIPTIDSSTPVRTVASVAPTPVDVSSSLAKSASAPAGISTTSVAGSVHAILGNMRSKVTHLCTGHVILACNQKVLVG
ncbi:hypothetical protein C8T65DRAFT_635430 [Cerioporus squamosus]|nr:hypothetical protein C8T65DRAFT_635430 [Cerioporus squamosus]